MSEAAGVRQEVSDQGSRVVVWTGEGEPFPGLEYHVRVCQCLARDGYAPEVVLLHERGLSEGELQARRHVLTGGAVSTRKGVQWMRDALTQLERVVDRVEQGEAAVVGICLGAQMLAHVIAGRAVTRDCINGIEVGLARVVDTGGSRREWIVPEFHYEEIEPSFLQVDGVRHCLRNEHSEIQGFAALGRAAGYQFHPELSASDAREIACAHGELIRQNGGDPEEALAATSRLQSAWRGDVFQELVTGVFRDARP